MKIFRVDSQYEKIDQLAVLFMEYFIEISNFGNLLPLAKNGEQLWLDGIKKSIGKTSVLTVAENNGLLVGFGHGQLKLTPDYLGSLRVGVVSHFYLDKKYRGGNFSAKMFEEMNFWFNEKAVASIELQVVEGNEKAYKFWSKLGFKPELKQMRLKY
ncbi:MAG: GNAT family N-acetyltransferase [Bacteroidota bacterium]|jgi:GNAT superfamily N-acetyltransferase